MARCVQTFRGEPRTRCCVGTVSARWTALRVSRPGASGTPRGGGGGRPKLDGGGSASDPGSPFLPRQRQELVHHAERGRALVFRGGRGGRLGSRGPGP